jgi:hypothetical protein
MVTKDIQLLTRQNKTGANIVLAIVGLTVVNSTFGILLGIYVNARQTFFKIPCHWQAAKPNILSTLLKR